MVEHFENADALGTCLISSIRQCGATKSSRDDLNVLNISLAASFERAWHNVAGWVGVEESRGSVGRQMAGGSVDVVL